MLFDTTSITIDIDSSVNTNCAMIYFLIFLLEFHFLLKFVYNAR